MHIKRIGVRALYNKIAIVICLLTLPITLSTAQVPDSQHTIIKEGLYARYLKDTVNAASKIKELMTEVKGDNDANSRSIAIARYQIALTLAPYARDSFRVLSVLYANFSGMLFDVGASDLSVKYAKKSLAYRHRYIYQPSASVYNIIGRIGSYYLKSQQYDSARVYFEKAKTEAYGTNGPLWESSAENNIGILFEREHMPDSALAHFIKAKNIISLKKGGETLLMGSIQDNIADNLYDRKQYSKAKDIYKSNELLYASIGNPTDIAQAMLGEAHSLIGMTDAASALVLLQQCEQYIAAHNINAEIKVRLNMLSAWEEYYALIGNWKQVSELQNQVSALNDSISNNKKVFLDQLINALTESQLSEARKGIQIYELQLSDARKKARTNVLILLIIIISGCCIVVLLVVFFRNRIRIQTNKANLEQYRQELIQKELENKKLEQEKLEQELNYKKGDLHDLGIYLTRLKDIHASLTEKLTDIKKQHGDEQRENINHLISELDTQIYSQQRLEMINENIEHVNREFYDKLIKVYPNLTKSEVELCGYLKLNMSNKEISILKGTSGETIKMARYRLRKKLNLHPDDDIYKAIASI